MHNIMKSNYRSNSDNYLCDYKKVMLQIGENQKVVALLRKHKDIDEIVDAKSHIQSGRSGKYNNVNYGVMDTGIFCFLLVRKKGNIEENEIYNQIMNDFDLISEVVTNRLDCILVGYDYDGFHEKEYLKFVDYIEQETGLKWEDSPQLIIAELIKVREHYKFIKDQICVIDIEGSIKSKVAKSAVELIRLVCRDIETASDINAVIVSLKKRYKNCGVRFEIKERWITVGEVVNVANIVIEIIKIIWCIKGL